MSLCKDYSQMESQQPSPTHLPPSVVDVFRTIVKENRGIRLEDLLPEYEVRLYACWFLFI